MKWLQEQPTKNGNNKLAVRKASIFLLDVKQNLKQHETSKT